MLIYRDDGFCKLSEVDLAPLPLEHKPAQYSHKNFSGYMLIAAQNITTEKFEYLLNPNDPTDQQIDYLNKKKKKNKKKKYKIHQKKVSMNILSIH